MIIKVKKFLNFLKILATQPSLINIILTDNGVQEQKFKQKYINFTALPQVEIKDLAEKNCPPVESFLLDGSSLITDLQLLATLAGRTGVHSYIEIGTWRGESVHNVAKELADCTTVNLSTGEMEELGLDRKYVQQHALLSGKNAQIKHVEANTKTFDFKKLGRKYDLIFIDGDHHYEMVVNDTKKVFEHLVHDHSIVVWHDYAFSPQKIRYEVFQGILDGIGTENHGFLYHPKNTLCAVFIKGDFPNTPFDAMGAPTALFEIELKSRPF